MFSGGMLERLFMGTTLGDFGWHAFTVKLLSYCYFGVFIKHSFTVFIVSPGMVIVDSMCYFLFRPTVVKFCYDYYYSYILML